MLAGSSALLLAAAPKHKQAPGQDWRSLGEDVRRQMRWAWEQYRQRAWGKDQIKPISGGSESFPLKKHHLGLTIVEALDKLWVMGLDDEFRDGVEWVKGNLDFDVDGEVSVFETSIRLVGGLLSAFHASGDPVLLGKARDCADRLLPSFNASPLGIPHRFINLRTGALRDPITNPAETGTFIPEFGFLSRATGDDRYRAAAKRALVSMFERRSKIGLLADAMDCMTGEWKSRRATIGPPSDGYYEYLWDGWDLLGDRDCLAMYRACTAAILRYQPQTTGGHLWFVDVDFETGKRINWDQDELASFYGGLLAQGGAVREGAAYTHSWADAVLIAPASADVLAKLAHGFADDLLCTLCLAATAPLAVAPAMNHRMWLHPATQTNVATLRARGAAILGPANGPLAEGESGPGRMLEPQQLVQALLAPGGTHVA